MVIRRIALALVLLFGFCAASRPLFLYPYPISWDVWYHVRVADAFIAGDFFWDHSTFVPEGRPQTYPPLFHLIIAAFGKMSGTPALNVVFYLPPFLFSLCLLSFFFFVCRLYDERHALVATLLASTSPILLDKGLAPLPETLSFTFLFFGFVLFFERKRICLLLFMLVFLTHGLAFVACVSAIVTFTLGWIAVSRDRGQAVFSATILGVLLLLTSPYYLFSYATKVSVPHGGRHLLSFYPTKLGWMPLSFACLGLPLLKRERSDTFIASLVLAGFLLSLNPILLPSRFLVFLAWPLAVLASRLVCGFPLHKKRTAVALVGTVFLLGFFQSHTYTEKFKPEIDEADHASMSWLASHSILGAVYSSWQDAPPLAAISGRPVFWGGYEMTAPRLAERKRDEARIREDWNRSTLQKYGLVYLYLEDDEPIPHDKIFCSRSGIYRVSPKG